MARSSFPRLLWTYDSGVSERDDSSTVVVGAVGAAVIGARVARGAVGLVGAGTRIALRLPVIGPLGRRGVNRIVGEGEQFIAGPLPVVVAVATALVVRVVSVIVAELDLTTLVRENVDLDAVATGLDIEAILDRVDLDAVIADRVDLNAAVRHVDLDAVAKDIDIDAIAARIDIEAILGRVDMIGLANEIIDGVDLTDIIRDASSSVTADVMTDVRSSGERADDVVANAVNRMLRRRVDGSDRG